MMVSKILNDDADDGIVFLITMKAINYPTGERLIAHAL